MSIRLTTHLPIEGTRVGLVVWFGSVSRGWVGKHVNPRKWGQTWRVSGVEHDPWPRHLEYMRGVSCDCCMRNDVPVVTWNDYDGTTVCEDCYVAMRDAA